MRFILKNNYKSKMAGMPDAACISSKNLISIN